MSNILPLTLVLTCLLITKLQPAASAVGLTCFQRIKEKRLVACGGASRGICCSWAKSNDVISLYTLRSKFSFSQRLTVGFTSFILCFSSGGGEVL